jgi:hypothetical protein
MALSRAAAAAARKAAKKRGLQGNRGKDGSLITLEEMQQKMVDAYSGKEARQGFWTTAEEAAEMETSVLVHRIERVEAAIADSKKQLGVESEDFRYAMKESDRAWTDETMETPLYNMEGDDMTLDAMGHGLDIIESEITEFESQLKILETELASRKTA